MLNFGKSKKEEKKNRGKFIVIDGIDGSGKTTQLAMLKEELGHWGHSMEEIHFPQHGTRSAALVDDYLAGKYGEVNAYAASVFFAADRFDAAPKIRAWLDEGKIVLSDRYVTSNAGHQGGKISDYHERVKYFKWLDNLEYTVFGIPKPDLTVVLNVPAEAAIQLLENREGDQGHQDNIHEANIGHLQSSHGIYLEIAKLFPNTKLVECVENNELLPPDQIHNKVWDLVRRIALKDTK